MSQILSEKNMTVPEHLKDLYLNTPLFDELIPTYSNQENGDTSNWNRVMSYITYNSIDKIKRDINHSIHYRQQIESQDALVTLCSTRKKKNILDERLPKFPFTYVKMKSKHVKAMEVYHKKHKAKLKQKLTDLKFSLGV